VLQRAYDTITTHDDAIETARAANALGRYLAHNRIDDERGTALMEEARTTFKAAGLPFDEARVMDDLAFSYPMGEARTALVDASIALRREIGDKVGLGNALRNRGGTYQLMGDLTNAAKAWGEANAIAIEMGDLINEAWCQTLLTLLEMAEKGLDTDLTRLDRVRTIAKETNLPVVHALVDSATALRMTSHGEPGEALALAERLLHDFGVDPYFMSIASTVKAVALCRLGHAREAVAFLLGGLPPESYSAAFLIIAMAAAEVAPAEDAARWLGRAQRGDVVTSLYDRLPFLVAVRQRLREELGEEAFEEAQQEGLTMPMSTAIAEIRQQVNNEGAA
jgi:tetratricopeptide (TPR) repeat protein